MLYESFGGVPGVELLTNIHTANPLRAWDQLRPLTSYQTLPLCTFNNYSHALRQLGILGNTVH